MIDKNYNGWTNWQTWNINLMYEEMFQSLLEEQEYDDSNHFIDSICNLVKDLEFQDLKESSLAWVALETYLSCVNWKEIADHYFEEETVALEKL